MRYDCKFGLAAEQFRVFYQADSTSPLAHRNTPTHWRSTASAMRLLPSSNVRVAGNVGNVEIAFCLLLKYALLKDKESCLAR